MRRITCLLTALALACGDDDGVATPDAGPQPLGTEHCEYEPLAPTARAGGVVTAGAISAGVAEVRLDLPVGSALGGNTSRAVALDNRGRVDRRRVSFAGGFNPSVGIETIPVAKALALTAGDETVVIVRTDTIFSDDSLLFALEAALGPDFAGKVIWASTHTHTAAEQFHADSKLQVGGGVIRQRNRDRLLVAMTEAAQAALAARAPARLGIAVDTDFDPDDQVSYDRRPDNDALFGGQARKDGFLALIRVDTAAGAPLAILPVLGVHSAILSDDTALFSGDVSGAWERALEEQFDQHVVVMHLQGAGGDVLPESQRHLEPADGDLDHDFARAEENARRALPALLALWTAAGEQLRASTEIEMVTRAIELGPDWRTFDVRGGALRYAPFSPGRLADREIFGAAGEVLSPIDEFNAPGGAGLCGDPGDDTFQNARMPGVDGLVPYHSCGTLPEVTLILGQLLGLSFEAAPLCASTRTTLSALRLGDFVFATVPGEPLVLWAESLRARSPVAADRTVVIGYAQGHVGYVLTAEDWLQGGFEPSINLWGPLEGERLLEQSAALLPLVVSPAREDGAAEGAARVVPPVYDDGDVPAPDPAPLAGTVPAVVPELVYQVGLVRPAQGQPVAQVPRVSGVARFVWIGEDPLTGTPHVRLQREEGGGFVDATRRSGRAVEDLDLLLTWTPDPLRPAAGEARTHYWAVAWQAVAWHGAPGLDALEDRPGLPLGRYRFHVEGTGYVVDSAPFEVVPGPLVVTATVAAGALTVTAAYDAPEGFRLLALDGLSNRPLPVAVGPLTVEVEHAGGAVETFSAALGAAGTTVVMPSSVDDIVAVRVADRFGNRGGGVP